MSDYSNVMTWENARRIADAGEAIYNHGEQGILGITGEKGEIEVVMIRKAKFDKIMALLHDTDLLEKILHIDQTAVKGDSKATVSQEEAENILNYVFSK